MTGNYWLGLATLPGLVLLYVLAVSLGSRVLAWAVTGISWTAHRIKPDAPMIQHRLRASAVYSAKHGIVLARGHFGLVLIYKMDPERRAWANEQLAETIDVFSPTEDFKQRMSNEEKR